MATSVLFSPAASGRRRTSVVTPPTRLALRSCTFETLAADLFGWKTLSGQTPVGGVVVRSQGA
jgi:hypothetical protein